MQIDSDSLRVMLKSPELADAESIAKNANDPDVAHDVASAGQFPYPYTLADAHAFIDSATKSMESGLGYHFSIHLKGNGVIGACGIYNLDSIKEEGEIGYWIGKEHWGKGYGTEAVMLLLGFGFKKLKLKSVSANTFIGNPRSIGLLSKLGFQKVAGDSEKAIFSIKSEEYVSAQISVEG